MFRHFTAMATLAVAQLAYGQSAPFPERFAAQTADMSSLTLSLNRTGYDRHNCARLTDNFNNAEINYHNSLIQLAQDQSKIASGIGDRSRARDGGMSVVSEALQLARQTAAYGIVRDFATDALTHVCQAQIQSGGNIPSQSGLPPLKKAALQ